MTIHFETIDPLGKKVICTKDRWFKHILVQRKAQGWEDGDGWEKDVCNAIENPYMIVQDVDYNNGQNYIYRPGVQAFYLKVCVRFIDDIGQVVTTFEINTIKPGEKLLWPQL